MHGGWPGAFWPVPSAGENIGLRMSGETSAPLGLVNAGATKRHCWCSAAHPVAGRSTRACSVVDALCVDMETVPPCKELGPYCAGPSAHPAVQAYCLNFCGLCASCPEVANECGNPISADGYYAGEAYGAGPQYSGKFEAAPSPGYGQYGTAGAPGQYSY